MSPKPSGEILFQGNLQVEEVAQDDGNDGACLQSDNKAMFGIQGGMQRCCLWMLVIYEV